MDIKTYLLNKSSWYHSELYRMCVTQINSFQFQCQRTKRWHVSKGPCKQALPIKLSKKAEQLPAQGGRAHIWVRNSAVKVSVVKIIVAIWLKAANCAYQIIKNKPKQGSERSGGCVSPPPTWEPPPTGSAEVKEQFMVFLASSEGGGR